MSVSRFFCLATSLLLVLGINSAWAQTEDALMLSASYSLRTDSNIFRLPASTLSKGGNLATSEQINISSLGLHINKPYSLQRLELNINLIDSQYQHFNYLSFMAHNVDAAWHWSITPRLHGNLTSSRQETLNSFADNNQSIAIRNQRTNTNTRFNTLYELNGAWRAVGGVNTSSQNSVQPTQAEGNTSTVISDAGLQYVWGSESTLSYTYKNTSGKYTNRTRQPTVLFDDSFNQRDNELKLRWVVSGKSTIDLSSTYLSRTHPHYAQRNYAGFNTNVGLNWVISGKSTLTFNWARVLASYQDNATNFTRTNNLSLGSTWRLSPKTSLRLRYGVAIQDYQGSPTDVPTNSRSDTTYDTSISFEWVPYEHLTFSTSLQNARRTSNQAGLDYNSNMATFAAQYSY
jgi:exopolysaccharide biosynthesis operon protein EpsL